MHDPDKTDKINIIPRCPKRDASETVRHFIKQALPDAKTVGRDIHDALTKLLASVSPGKSEEEAA